MYDSLIRYFETIEDEELLTVEIEEVAIISAWAEAQSNDILPEQRRGAISEKVEFWLNTPRDTPIPTEGRRLQPLLRVVLDRAVEEGPKKLHRNELDLLIHAASLVERSSNREQYSRLSQYFERNLDAIKKVRANTLPSPGMTGLNNFVKIVTADDILQAPRKSVNSFAGVDKPGRGPLLRHTGTIKIMGQVPDDAMVVAENGKCLVHGYVFGRVAATYDCEVRDNISGIVVVSLGDVRARKILTGSFVVSKWGQIVARDTETPELVFGGKQIRLREDADGGRYAAPEIMIEGSARSGEFCASRRISAERFECADTRGLSLVLRQTITPEDYGGLIDSAATKILSAIRRKRQRRDAWKDMIAMAQEETRQFAANGIRFLTGGEKLLSGLQAMDKQERELSFCVRVLSAIDSIVLTIEDQIAASIADSALPGGEAIRDSSLLVREISGELKGIIENDKENEELEGPISELDDILDALTQAEQSEVIPDDLVGLLRERGEYYVERRGDLLESLQRKAAAIEKLLGDTAKIVNSDEVSSTVVLNRLIDTALKRPPEDALHKRTRSNFLKVMLRSIESRKDRIAHYSKMVGTIEAELEELATTLEREAKIPPPPELDTTPEPPRAEGVFGPGVVICLERYLVDANSAPAGTRLVTEDSGGERKTYVRTRNQVRLDRETQDVTS